VEISLSQPIDWLYLPGNNCLIERGTAMPISKEKLEQAGRYIPNLRVVSDHLVRGGQPEPEGLRCLYEAGVKTIINLCGGPNLVSLFKKSAGSSCAESPEVSLERNTAQLLGMQFIAIPLDVFREPNEQSLNAFLEIVREIEKHGPVFVHCLHGRDRTGLMTALYRVACNGWSAEKAYAEMLECGFDGGRTNLSDALFEFAKKKS
jgi:protein tyrosine/serine phosphatase